MGATDTVGRVLASVYKSGPLNPLFSSSLDVPNGGVLFGLPGLLSMGLLRHAEKYFSLPDGYYRLDTIFLLLGFMALARVKNIESLRYCSPGEWGNLLGLDRIPEVKTLRKKIKLLSQDDQAIEWSGELSRDWMGMFPEATGVLYIDGHVRVYNGSQVELPRHYVARQRLCLRATVDYWVNAMDGQPFFMVNKAVDPGLLRVLEDEIVPRLEQEVPCQPSLFAQEDRYLQRFTLVFDREGYSPDFMRRMWNRRIACLTYHKYPDDDWPESEFTEQAVSLVSGHEVTIQLAERGILLSGKLWVREIRKLRKNGNQTSIISTDFTSTLPVAAAAMFARWSQENFFKYMRENYGIDKLVDYSTEEIPDTTMVVNPMYREVDGETRKEVARLARKQCECSGIVLCDDIEPARVAEYETKKAELQEEITALSGLVDDLKACRKSTPKHVLLADLPKEDRFRKLGMKSKYLVDTIKLVAYRAETAMVNIVGKTMNRGATARSLLRALYSTEADILPDYEKKTLTIRLHQLATWSSGATIMNLCRELTATQTVFPGTELRMIYDMVS